VAQDAVDAEDPALDSASLEAAKKIPKGRMDQFEDFQVGKTDFPARPRNMWELGISGGIAQVSGDVRSNYWGRGKDHWPSLSYGIHVRKALGYVMSLRAEYIRGIAYGQNWQPSSGIDRNPVLNGQQNPDLNYADSPGVVYHNYKTQINDLSVQAVLTLNNIKYHKDRNRVGLNVIAGFGLANYATFIDQLDADGNLYDYSAARALGGGEFEDRGAVLDALAEIYDGEYETAAEGQSARPSLLDRTYRPVLTGGAGVHILISPRFSMALEHKVKLTNDDLLDGQRWEETNTLSRDFDTYHYSSLHLNIHLGSKERNDIPSWWVNPMTFSMDPLAGDAEVDMGDDDNDGVLNILDQEPDTPEDCPVDTRGVTLDSDRDGCPDCDDPEPFSTPERPIQNCVNVGGAGAIDEPEVRRIVQDMLGDPSVSAGGSDWYLPMIHFDLDRDFIKTEFFPELKHVADVMSRYPKLQVEVIGFADTRNSEEYNLDLSRRRAVNSINHMVERYGIDPNRFILRYEGEDQNLVPNAAREGDHYMNRRVEFRAVIGDQ
jgi:outer membrane protein OmpA-like peptidoglycan-associated protein